MLILESIMCRSSMKLELFIHRKKALTKTGFKQYTERVVRKVAFVNNFIGKQRRAQCTRFQTGLSLTFSGHYVSSWRIISMRGFSNN